MLDVSEIVARRKNLLDFQLSASETRTPPVRKKEIAFGLLNLFNEIIITKDFNER